jgi:uncharacterized protein YndB with AHSA1/START domain
MNAADRNSQKSRVAAPKPSAPEPRPSEGLRRATGRDRAEWFAALDAWGAAGRPYREIADWLTGEHSFSDWWAQKLIVEYEEARGLRAPGVRRDGTFEVGASKTVAVPVDRLRAAFVEARLRERWLPGAVMRKASYQARDSLRFEWGDGPSRVEVDVTEKAATRSQVVVQHKRLPDARAAEEMKTHWRERLVALKSLLES